MYMPEKIRFFRGQMQTIITRACGEVGVEAVPSRRCIALMSARPVGVTVTPRSVRVFFCRVC